LSAISAGTPSSPSPTSATKGTHLFRSINANSAYINPVTNALVRNYSSAYGTSTINFRESNGDSLYDAMNLELRHSFYKHGRRREPAGYLEKILRQR
jgi:hypothetical protein